MNRLKFEWPAFLGGLLALVSVIEVFAISSLAWRSSNSGQPVFGTVHKVICNCWPGVEAIQVCALYSTLGLAAAFLVPAAVLISLQIWMANATRAPDFRRCAVSFGCFGMFYMGFFILVMDVLGRAPLTVWALSAGSVLFVVACTAQGLAYRALAGESEAVGANTRVAGEAAAG